MNDAEKVEDNKMQLQKHYGFTDSQMEVLKLAHWAAYDEGIEAAAEFMENVKDQDLVVPPNRIRQLKKLNGSKTPESTNQNPE